jgi:hypothetical protein
MNVSLKIGADLRNLHVYIEVSLPRFIQFYSVLTIDYDI